MDTKREETKTESKIVEMKSKGNTYEKNRTSISDDLETQLYYLERLPLPKKEKEEIKRQMLKSRGDRY